MSFSYKEMLEDIQREWDYSVQLSRDLKPKREDDFENLDKELDEEFEELTRGIK